MGHLPKQPILEKIDAKQPIGNYATGSGSAIGTNTGDQFTNLPSSRILGRATAGFGGAEDLTGVQATALLSVATSSNQGVMSAADKAKLDGLSGSSGMSWLKLSADGAATSSNSAYTASTLSFTAAANTTYIVELNGSFLTAATTTGISIVLDIPSGVIMGNVLHHAAAAQTVTGSEQVADNASPQTGTSGVRAANAQTSMLGRWIIEIGATGGAVTLGYRSEVSGSSVTLKKPTALGYQAI